MARIGWQEINGPDFGTALRGLSGAGEAIRTAFSDANAGVDRFRTDRVRMNSNRLMGDLMRFQGDPTALQQAVQDGSLMGGRDTSMLSSEAIAAIGARAQDLQNFRLGESNIRGVDLRNNRTEIDTNQQVRENDEWIKTNRLFNVDRDQIRSARAISAEARRLALPGTPEAQAAAQAYLGTQMGTLGTLPEEAQVAIFGAPLGIARGNADLAQVRAGTEMTGVQTEGARIQNEAGRFSLDVAKEDRAAADQAFTALTPVLESSGDAQSARTAVEGEIRRLGLTGRAAEELRRQVGARFPGLYGPLTNYNGQAVGPLDADPNTAPQGAAPGTRPVLPGINTPANQPAAPATAPRNVTERVRAAVTGSPTAAVTPPNPVAERIAAAATAQPELRVGGNPAGASFGGGIPMSAILAAAASRADPSRVLNYEARGATGMTHVPQNIRTLGQASQFARELNRRGADSSAMGTYQIVGSTLRRYAPRVFGRNWENVEFNQAAQDRVAQAIFNDHRHSAQALRGQWVSLSLAQAERVRRMPWSQARAEIARGESGNGGATLARSGAPAASEGAPVANLAPINPITNQPIAVAPAPVQDPLSGRLFGGSRSMEEVNGGATPVSPDVELLQALRARLTTPQPVETVGRRRRTNVEAVLGHTGAVARYN